MSKWSEIEFLISSAELGMKKVPEFKLGLKITNSSGDLLPVDLSKSVLYVNAEQNFAWDLSVQNGTLVNLKIPPQHSETFLWPLGEALFETPGTYELNLIWETFSQKKQVIILNDEI